MKRLSELAESHIPSIGGRCRAKVQSDFQVEKNLQSVRSEEYDLCHWLRLLEDAEQSMIQLQNIEKKG